MKIHLVTAAIVATFFLLSTFSDALRFDPPHFRNLVPVDLFHDAALHHYRTTVGSSSSSDGSDPSKIFLPTDLSKTGDSARDSAVDSTKFPGDQVISDKAVVPEEIKVKEEKQKEEEREIGKFHGFTEVDLRKLVNRRNNDWFRFPELRFFPHRCNHHNRHFHHHRFFPKNNNNNDNIINDNIDLMLKKMGIFERRPNGGGANNNYVGIPQHRVHVAAPQKKVLEPEEVGAVEEMMFFDEFKRPKFLFPNHHHHHHHDHDDFDDVEDRRVVVKREKDGKTVEEKKHHHEEESEEKENVVLRKIRKFLAHF